MLFEGEDVVRDWLDEITRGRIDWFDDWLIYWEDSPRDADFAGFDNCWRNIQRVAGGSLLRSNEIDVRRLFGSIAECHDWAHSPLQDDVRLHHVDAREALITVGVAPSGVWEARLIGDLFENAHITYQSWRELDADAATAQLAGDVDMLRSRAEALIATSLSIPARRSAHAVAAVCAMHTANPTDVDHHVDSFFVLDQQAVRESGSEADERDLLFVTLAGATVRATRGDRDGVQELMRKVRQRAEPAGERLPHAYMAMWSSALMTLDPLYAQMLAEQLLIDETADGFTDDSFAAAYLLFQASVAVGDEEKIVDLLTFWSLAALDVEGGPGVQHWLNHVKVDPDDDVDDVEDIEP